MKKTAILISLTGLTCLALIAIGGVSCGKKDSASDAAADASTEVATDVSKDSGAEASPGIDTGAETSDGSTSETSGDGGSGA
jgi:hypothetical protein